MEPFQKIIQILEAKQVREYAIGIRAAQGITLDTANHKIWFTEHGMHQGDEINVLKAKANYGWPIKTTGRFRFAEFAPNLSLGISIQTLHGLGYKL